MEDDLLHPQRRVEVEGAFNIRDIGGYPTQDGRRIRWKQFLRADSMHALTDNDCDVLVDYGLAMVVDLRGAREIESKPNVFAGSKVVRYEHRPFLDQAELQRMKETPVLDRTHLMPNDKYAKWLDYCQPLVREILACLADKEDGAALYHCAGGKDRTGVVTALLLGLAEVSHDVIAADYALTARYNLQSTVQPAEPGINTWQDYEATYCPPGLMLQTLAHFDEHYDGMLGYVRHIGVSDRHVDRLRSMLVE